MKIVLITSGTTSPTRWAYTNAHNLRKHGYQATTYSWFSVLKLGDIIKFVKTSIDSGDIICVSDTYVLSHKDVSNFNLLYEAVSRKGCTVALCNSSVNKNVVKHDVDLTGRYKEDQILDFVNSKTGRIKRIPYDFYNCDFVWRAEDNFPPKTALPVEISRHCIFDCNFCAYPNRGAKSAPNRDMALIRRELDSANELFGTKNFSLMCSTFNDSKEKLDNFFSAIDGTDYEFAAFIRIDLLMKQKEYWPLFKKHIKHLCFGIDTLNWESGKAIGKATNPDKMKEWLREVKDYFHDCLTYSCFILGLPFSKPTDGPEWLDYLEESKVLDGYHFNPLGVMGDGDREYNSNFDRNIEKYGYTRTPSTDMWGREIPGWIREDGYSYDDSVAMVDALNARRKSAPLPFSSVMLTPFFGMQRVLDIVVTGTPGKMVNIPEYNAVLDATREGFWYNVGLIDKPESWKLFDQVQS